LPPSPDVARLPTSSPMPFTFAQSRLNTPKMAWAVSPDSVWFAPTSIVALKHPTSKNTLTAKEYELAAVSKMTDTAAFM